MVEVQIRSRTAAGPPVASPPRHPGRRNRLSPAGWVTLVFVVLTTQIPFLITLWNSFQQWNLMDPSRRGFVGLDNYRMVFTLPTFGVSLWNSARMTVGVVVSTIVIGTGLALLLNRSFRGRVIVRTAVFSAFLIPPAASALIWKTTMLDPSYGLLTFLLEPFGGSGVDWINQYPMGTVIAVTAWQWIPFTMLIVLAGLQNEDASAREAMMLDGAGSLRIFRYLTLSHLRAHIEVSALLGAIFVSQLLDPIFLLTQGGPGTATATAAYQLHALAFRSFDIGLASAFGVIVVVITIVTTLALLRLAVTSIRQGD